MQLNRHNETTIFYEIKFFIYMTRFFLYYVSVTNKKTQVDGRSHKIDSVYEVQHKINVENIKPKSSVRNTTEKKTRK